MPNEIYQYTIEDLERFLVEAGYKYIVETFKTTVEDSKPKDMEVWLVGYEGGTDYARYYFNGSDDRWYTSDGEGLHNEDIVPLKKVGVDE